MSKHKRAKLKGVLLKVGKKRSRRGKGIRH